MTPTYAINLTPIGRVHSPIAPPTPMPRGGVGATIEVFPEFEVGLNDIESNSHLIALGWFDLADRTALLASPRPRGVFGIRSSIRPNPIGLKVTRLIRRDGRRLEVDALDFFDGTLIVDIKRYAPGWDSVFAAMTSHELQFRANEADADALHDLVHEAARFHGELNASVALGARIVRAACQRWRVGQRDPRLIVTVGADGALADAVQALTGARFGDGRLRFAADTTVAIACGAETLCFRPLVAPNLAWQAVLTLPLVDVVAMTISTSDSSHA